ncbi:MAG TPA: zf-HC2 domain-containing protein [Ktedonobacteraceae bacterium]|jgi:predicted anti-sigma-YlaC factor YlaD|nr:zf-HC2 domain-containing protein [Ktedonobacteraceae bacterium]
MRCHNARERLGALRDGDLAPSEAQAVEEHLQHCSSCRNFTSQQHHLDTILHVSTSHARPNVSTERIMLAIQQQKRITDQLEDIRQQQHTRLAHFRPAGTACVALGFFTLSSIPLLLLALAIIQTDLTVKALYLLNGVIDFFIISAQYLHMGLTMATRNNWMLPTLALAVVVMMGMWLRLMRPPQEA